MDSLEEKTKAIVEKLSLKQKVRLLYGDGDWHTFALKKTPIRAIEMHDGPLGLRKPDGSAVPQTGELVGRSVPATCFPAPCLTACSWDPKLLAKIGMDLGQECLLQNTDVILAPGVNIKRNPLCGRNFEYLSEDPLLAGKMAASFINGAQGVGVGVSLKHFAANNQEYRRFSYSAEVDVRALRDLYLRPFEIAVKESNPWTVMCSYNQINGVYSSDNDWLLKDVLRKEWGFDGVVMSDWGATIDPVLSHNHGLDLEMPCHRKRERSLVQAVKRGQLKMEAVNEAALHLVTLNLRIQNRQPSKEAFNSGISHQTALKAAEESIVLAKNCGDFLPLTSLDDVCLIGALSKKFRYQGAGSSQMNPLNLVTLYGALNAGRDVGKEIPYEPGYPLSLHEDVKALRLSALDLASTHNKAILCLGLPEGYETEGYDRHDLRLPEEQYALIDAIASVNKNIVVVFLGGAPVEMPFEEKVPAILLAYLPGEAGGEAIKNVLLGKVNPSGKLAETWPLHYLDVPSHDFFSGTGNVAPYKESVFVGYRYYCTANRNVLFPFGHGLSYTQFTYSGFALSKDELKADGSIKASVTVTNSGKRDGSEVVQLYLSARDGKTFKPLRELKAFSKINIPAGKSATVIFTLPYSAFAHYDVLTKKLQVEGGQYLIEIGASCLDIRVSGFLQVSSSFKAKDDHAILPSYYNLRREGAFRVSDDEFSILLGHPLPVQHDRHRRPYTLNSTMEEISGTFIGKCIKNAVRKRCYPADRSKRENDDLFAMMMDSPIRMAGMAGLSEKTILAFLALANGKPFKAFFELLFGHRK